MKKIWKSLHGIKSRFIFALYNDGNNNNNQPKQNIMNKVIKTTQYGSKTIFTGSNKECRNFLKGIAIDKGSNERKALYAIGKSEYNTECHPLVKMKGYHIANCKTDRLLTLLNTWGVERFEIVNA